MEVPEDFRVELVDSVRYLADWNLHYVRETLRIHQHNREVRDKQASGGEKPGR